MAFRFRDVHSLVPRPTLKGTRLGCARARGHCSSGKSLISGQKLTRTQTPNPGLHVALTHTSNWDKYTLGVASHFVSACWKTIQTCKYFVTDIR